MALNILLFTISSRKYFVVYFALGPAVYVSLPIWISLIFILPVSWHAWLDEWKEKPLGTQNTNETENASTHAVSEMISFNIFPFQFTGVLPDVTLLTGHFIFPDFEPEQSHGSTKSRWPQVTVFW